MRRLGLTRRFGLALVTLAALAVAPAHAVQPDEMLPDPALEARARDISRELRCMVCQNQSIDDSDAPLARDLRLLVRERIKAGDSDRQIFDFLTARYGDFVLLKPRLSAETVLLWFVPLLALVGGGLIVVFALRRARRPRPGDAAAAPLSPEEEARLAALTQDRAEDAPVPR